MEIFMKLKFLLFLLLICMVFSSCTPKQEAEPSSSLSVSDTAITFTDALERAVTVDSPKRVAATLGSFAQIWMLAGGSVCATADDAWEDLQLELPADTVNLGNTKQLSLEQLFASEPDFILASTNTRQNLEWKDILDQTDIPVAYFDVSNFDDYLNLLNICTDITGRKDLYAQHGLDVQKQISEVLEKSQKRLSENEPPQVLSLVASASSLRAKTSESNVLGEMLKALGCVNIADSDTLLLEDLSIEHILLCDPDYIFIVQRGDDTEGMHAYVNQMLMEHPAWSKLTAVREGRVHFMEKTLYNLKPNHRWGLAYEQLEEIFADETQK